MKRYNEECSKLEGMPCGDERQRIYTILEYIRREILVIDGMIERGQTHGLHEKYDRINVFYNQIQNGRRNGA